ncbi:hypothetical protein [Dysgonomonas termitidis]|uniref:Uncharacterized protein n=1 Tax=Dysgonomonas termitidis TaxID=1516126 RepID=A0ABV9KUM4_9BACT
MNWYRISYSRLALLLLPPMLRNPVLAAFLNGALKPVSLLYISFLGFRGDIAYNLGHNGQVCYLQAVLNDAFDYSLRRIRITDAPENEWGRFLWLESEDRPIMLGIFILNREAFIGADGIDFAVILPASLNLTGDEYNRLNSLLRYYKMAGKRYVIIIKNEE